MSRYTAPLLTRTLADALLAARDAGEPLFQGSFDLRHSLSEAALEADGWRWQGVCYPWPGRLKDRNVYYWDDADFVPLQRYADALYKPVPTEWGPPTFEIDGIKMLPTARVTPYADALQKAALVHPHGRQVLDTCGGLGYFAAGCLAVPLHRHAQREDQRP